MADTPPININITLTLSDLEEGLRRRKKKASDERGAPERKDDPWVRVDGPQPYGGA
jgi:hypothetical protein